MFGKYKKLVAVILVVGCVMNLASCGDKSATVKKDEVVTLKWIFCGPGKQ